MVLRAAKPKESSWTGPYGKADPLGPRSPPEPHRQPKDLTFNGVEIA